MSASYTYTHSWCPTATWILCLFHQLQTWLSYQEWRSWCTKVYYKLNFFYTDRTNELKIPPILKSPQGVKCLTMEILCWLLGKAIKALNGLGTTSPCFVKYSWSGITRTCYLGTIFSCLKLSAFSLTSFATLTLIYSSDCSYRLYVWT